MVPVSSLLELDAGSSQPVYVQLSNKMIHFIQTGILKPGARLPSIRVMARELKLHPKTVVAAYGEMVAQDWVYSKPRSGMIVAENLPHLKPRAFRKDTVPDKDVSPGIISDRPRAVCVIDDGFPDYRMAPVEQLMRQFKNAFYYGEIERYSMFADPAGDPRLRMALNKYISESRAVKITHENILITRGAQMAMYLAAGLLIQPGDHVLVGEPGYATANSTFEQFGARLVRIPVDENGIDVDAVERALKARKPKLLYIIPHHHHPTTVTLSAARRMKLLSLIQEHKVYVLEDDYDYEYHYGHRPILPLASADHGGYVLYIGSITKNLSYSLKLGYLVASGKIIADAVRYKGRVGMRSDLLLEDALANLYENGTMLRHIRRSVKLYHERRDHFCALLEERLGDKVRFLQPDGGMAVWVQFNKKYSLPKIAALAAGKGLLMKDGTFYNTSGVNYNALRMGFASLDKEQMEKGFGVLSEVIKKVGR